MHKRIEVVYGISKGIYTIIPTVTDKNGIGYLTSEYLQTKNRTEIVDCIDKLLLKCKCVDEYDKTKKFFLQMGYKSWNSFFKDNQLVDINVEEDDVTRNRTYQIVPKYREFDTHSYTFTLEQYKACQHMDEETYLRDGNEIIYNLFAKIINDENE